MTKETSVEAQLKAHLISQAPAMLEVLKEYQKLIPALREINPALALALADNYAKADKIIKEIQQ